MKDTPAPTVASSHRSPATGVRLLLGACAAVLLSAPGASAAPGTVDRQGASGTVSFDCLLQPFRSGFRYEAATAVVAARQVAGDTEIQLSASFSDLPGISPAQIDDGKMTIVAKGTVDGQKFRLKGTSQVTSEPKAPIPMPRVTGQVTTPAETLFVEVTEFQLSFEEMMGLTIKTTCLPAKGSELGTMTVSSGSIDDEIARVTTAGRDEDVVPDASGDKDASRSLPMTALWGAVVVGAGVMVWLTRRGMVRR